MRVKLLLLLVTCSTAYAHSQCRADSVYNYRVMGNSQEMASAEYYTFDENDSLLKIVVKDYQGPDEIVTSQTDITRKKVKGNWVVSTTFAPGDGEAVYVSSREMVTYSKKGWLESRIYSDFSPSANSFVDTYKTIYTYNKGGQLIQQLSLRFDPVDLDWDEESKMDYVYNELNQNTEIVTYNRDLTKGTWENALKNNFNYDSLDVLAETVTYEYKNDAWLPRTRNQNGIDTTDHFKYIIVQKWDGAKSDWVNEACYIFQLNDLGQTRTEVHLSWNQKEWKIDLTVSYLYNEAGDIYQMMNDNGLVIMSRFCR